jgi:hypothetical protein
VTSSRKKRIALVLGATLVLVLAGAFLAVRYGDRGRTARLEKCIEAKRAPFEESLKGIGLRFGEPELWLAHPEVEEFAMFPIEGEAAGASKRFFRVHSGVENGVDFCRAGLVDGVQE